MKNLASIFAVAVLALSAECAAEGGITASVTLRDSSVIKGDVVEAEALKGSVAFENDAELPLAMVRTMEANGTNGAQVVTLANGDKFHFTPTTKALSVATVLGDLSIPLANIRRVDFSARRANSSGSLLFHCTFDSPEAVEKPAVGPGGTVLVPDAFETGKSGNALRVNPRRESARFSIPAGFLKEKGCIEWWAKIQSPSDSFSSCDPRFFRIRFSETVDSVVEFSSNDGLGGGGLVIRFPGLYYLQKRGHRVAWRYSQYFGEADAQQWHHYALVWNADGLAFQGEESSFRLALFIDGERIHVEPLDWRQKINVGVLASMSATMDFPFNGDHDNPLIGNAEYLIDDLKIWDCDTPPSP